MTNFSFFMAQAVTLLALTIVFVGCSGKSEGMPVKAESQSVATTTSTPVNVAEENFRNAWKSKFEETLTELEVNRSLWRASNINDYRFVAAKQAGGTTNMWNRLPVVITVENGGRTSIEKQSKGKDYVIYSRTDGFDDFDTLDKLFDYLRRELEAGRMLGVKYDKKLGYPKDVQIIFSFEIHGGRSISISEFESIR